MRPADPVAADPPASPASGSPAATEQAPAGPAGPRGYGRGAAVLSAGIGATGLVTYLYFSLASHALDPAAYGRITLLWSAIFIAASILYRPVEQLLSRTIAAREERGHRGHGHLRVAGTIQAVLAAGFAVVALALRGPLERGLLGGSAVLYWTLVVAVVAYAASYFARGFLAGHRRFGLYGSLVLLEATSRCLFALAVAVGVFAGASVVALGLAAAPIVSLAVVPWALARKRRRGRAGAGFRSPGRRPCTPEAPVPAEPPSPAAAAGEAELTLGRGGGFAAAVLVVVACEQAFLNAGPLLVGSTSGAAGAALAGVAFNVLLIARAPLQLFQAVQTSILPHLTRLSARGAADPFRRSVDLTLAAIAAFWAAVLLVVLAAGPALMRLFAGGGFHYARGGLALVALGMGLYLAAATLSQAALARGQARQAAACWAAAAAAFVLLLLVPGLHGAHRILQLEGAYLLGALLLASLLHRLRRRGER